MKRNWLKWIALAATVAGLLLLLPEDAWARLGGGHSFGGGGSRGGGGSSGGGGGDGELIVLVIRLLVWLCIEHPVIGIPLTIVVIGGIIFVKANSSKEFRYSSTSHSAARPRPVQGLFLEIASCLPISFQGLASPPDEEAESMVPVCCIGAAERAMAMAAATSPATGIPDAARVPAESRMLMAMAASTSPEAGASIAVDEASEPCAGFSGRGPALEGPSP